MSDRLRCDPDPSVPGAIAGCLYCVVMNDMPTVDVTDHPDESRYEARVGDVLAGFVDYSLGAATIDFTHTEVDKAFEGQGIGSALIRQALDSVREDGQRSVIATCPFVAKWIDKHPDYADLLA